MSKKCVRKACLKQYTDEENIDGACRYHPGGPIFHEGLKGWSCCPKKFSDFSEFLSHPGCLTGIHTTEKEVPADPDAAALLAKKEADAAEAKKTHFKPMETEIEGRIKSTQPLSEPAPMKVSSSLKTALVKQQAVIAASQSSVIAVGTSCTRNACKGKYVDGASNSEDCICHPGTPVFHEGMKYWSCCSKKKTHDFEEFLSFPGCVVEKHRWIKPLSDELKAKTCRYDWIQTPTHISISIFAKNIDPDRTTVKVNEDTISMSITYELSNMFVLELDLLKYIDPSDVAIELLSMKMDIKVLKKEPAISWPSLTYVTKEVVTSAS